MDSVIKHPAAGAERERDEKRKRRTVDTELIRAADESAAPHAYSEHSRRTVRTARTPPPLCTYCRPLQVDKATRELSLPLTWPW